MRVAGLAMAGCGGVVRAPLSPCMTESAHTRSLVLVCVAVLSCPLCVAGLAVLLGVPGCVCVCVCARFYAGTVSVCALQLCELVFMSLGV